MAGRFDYVKYDETALNLQGTFKAQYEEIAKDIESLGASRPLSLALTHLEESYMWIGKALRDAQAVRNPEGLPLNEDRG